MEPRFQLPLRRIAAFIVDWCVVAAYAGLLFLLVSPLVRPLFSISPFTSELVAFCLLTLPMGLYFALSEASTQQATVGKRLLKLRVTTVKGGRVRTNRSFTRTALKFLPWELAHFAVWNVFVFSNSPAAGIGMVALVLSYALSIAYGVSLFGKSTRTPYDRLSKTAVRG